jgi:hypothetical protein
MEVSIEEYMPLGLIKEEAIRRAMEDSELIELAQLEGLSIYRCACAPHPLALTTH